ncbi:MAG: CDP-diacylglycerol--serine O-phosphatidyltransferase [Proteobacteria bacterium]|nr:CDP-diacylglycerol--serine O-phosphatidyltransferase [Pseudomonadota bacterium]MBU1612729.1 CDP-diacylglycerol--serine O-phosphatidyltransferase [Pseudomonadota bacterium]
MTADEKRNPRKGIYVLPNILTTASLFLGFMGIMWAIEGDYTATSWAILGSCIFDGLDGKVARMTNTTSEFGVQLDSLADLVAFGVTPAVMVYLWQLSEFGRLGLMASFLFIACGALRLARFNVTTAKISKKFFIGLPIPAAACTLASTYLASTYLSPALAQTVLPTLCLVLAYLLSFLMVSTIRFFSFKEFGYFRAHSFSTMVVAILVFVLVASRPRLLLFAFFMGYIGWGISYTLFYLARRGSRLTVEKHHDKSHEDQSSEE